MLRGGRSCRVNGGHAFVMRSSLMNWFTFSVHVHHLTLSVHSKEFFTIEIMIFVRPTRGHGGPYRVNNDIRTSHQRTQWSLYG